jgi:hypothetical protein
MSDSGGHDPRTSYDAVADEYATRIAGELAHKPFDCALLDRFAARVGTLGTVADVGCGSGHVARYFWVALSGADVGGTISPGFREIAVSDLPPAFPIMQVDTKFFHRSIP